MAITNKKALIVDDVEFNRDVLCSMLGPEYDIIEATNGIEAMDALKLHGDEINVMLLDLVMPKMSGIEVLDNMSFSRYLDRFPVLIITGEESPEIESECLKRGVADFIRKPFNSELVKHRLKNAETLFAYKNSLEDKVHAQMKQLIAQANTLKMQNEKLNKRNEQIMDLLSDMVEARNMESGAHVKRVKTFTRILAEDIKNNYPRYGLTDDMINKISSASAMHDLGKISIPDAILLKPGKLTNDEFTLMKKHSEYGCDILDRTKNIWEDDYFAICKQICRWHHEKWDGRGYPDGLKGSAIPLSAQLVSVADCYDALTTKRVYKDAFTPDTALNMILNGECGQFNPDLMESLKRCQDQFKEAAESIR